METISWDPGETTGCAVVASDGSILATYALYTREDVRGMATRLRDRYPEADAVIEQGPLHGGNGRSLTQGIEEDLRTIFPDATWTGPGEWKGHPVARQTRAMKGISTHEKDAAGLGCFHQATRRQRDGRRGS